MGESLYGNKIYTNIIYTVTKFIRNKIYTNIIFTETKLIHDYHWRFFFVTIFIHSSKIIEDCIVYTSPPANGYSPCIPQIMSPPPLSAYTYPPVLHGYTHHVYALTYNLSQRMYPCDN
jgi:hypothetical protein